MGPLSGYVFDQFGPRVILLIGTFMHVFGLMMASISTEYYQFLLSQGVCSAIGAACIFTPAVACVSTWFYKKRGMAIGAAAAGSSLGGVLFPIIVSRMIREVGFGWAMRTCAFLILGLSESSPAVVQSQSDVGYQHLFKRLTCHSDLRKYFLEIPTTSRQTPIRIHGLHSTFQGTSNGFAHFGFVLLLLGNGASSCFLPE